MEKKLKEILRKIKKREDFIKKIYNAEILGVFGSFARGEQSEKSDIDILVRFKEGATLFDFVGLADFLEEDLNIKVDIVSERALRPELKETVLKDIVSV